MSLYASFKKWLLPEHVREQDVLVELIEGESKRLDGAIDELHKERRVAKRDRIVMARLFDDTLQAMSKGMKR